MGPGSDLEYQFGARTEKALALAEAIGGGVLQSRDMLISKV